jgi:hypothetical protein
MDIHRIAQMRSFDIRQNDIVVREMARQFDQIF